MKCAKQEKLHVYYIWYWIWIPSLLLRMCNMRVVPIIPKKKFRFSDNGLIFSHKFPNFCHWFGIYLRLNNGIHIKHHSSVLSHMVNNFANTWKKLRVIFKQTLQRVHAFIRNNIEACIVLIYCTKYSKS